MSLSNSAAALAEPLVRVVRAAVKVAAVVDDRVLAVHRRLRITVLVKLRTAGGFEQDINGMEGLIKTSTFEF
jgi:hypothetical protein